MYAETEQIKKLVGASQKIVVVQADNPDADSLGSALALESILGDLGKDVHMYCGVDMPTYLRYMQGWDRVQAELPNRFDMSVIVDASTMSLLERLVEAGYQGRLAAKPCVVLDHHAAVDHLVPFATVTINDHEAASSAGELIYKLSKDLGWKMPVEAQTFIMTAILGDTQGLSNQLASSGTYRLMADMVEAGVDRPALEELRRESSKMPLEIYKYKAELISRTEFAADGRVAYVTVPQAEINQYSPLYNPGPLIQGDMLQTSGVMAAIVFKHYGDGKVTAAIRANAMAPIAADLAQAFGGGGHAFASGFKITDGRSISEVSRECVKMAAELLDNLSKAENR